MPLSWLENERTQFPVGVSDSAGNKHVRRMLVPYSYGPLDTIKEKLLGTAYLQAGGLVRQLPWKDPNSPNLRVERVEFKGLAYRGNDAAADPAVPMTTGNAFEFWEVTAHLALPQYLVGAAAPFVGDDDVILGAAPDVAVGETSRYATKVVRAGRLLLTPRDSSVFYWDNPAGKRVPVDYPVPLRIPYQEVECVWWHVPIECYPASAIDLCLGSINNFKARLPTVPAPAPPAADGLYPAGTLMLEEARTQGMEFPDGRRGLNVMYHFGYMRYGWDHLPGPDGVWRKIYLGNSNDTAYPQTNFDYLWKIEQQFAGP